MKNEIKEFIYRRDNVSFAELMHAIPHSSGERTICHQHDSLILWEGVSEAFSEAIQHLIRDDEVVMRPADLMVYVADRKMLDYPVAKRIQTYTKPHWLPVVFCKP